MFYVKGGIVIKKPDEIIEYVILNLDEGNQVKKNTIYTDEPIIFTASKMKSYLPKKYFQMKEFAQNFNCYIDTEASLFYKQAKFMENFEDDFNYTGNFVRSFPTYRLMNDQQLRGYFSFRTKVRHGEIKKTCTSYAFVYCYELLHGIGVSNALDGYNKLLKFSKSYGAVDPMFGNYYIQWLNDYVIYNNLDKKLLNNTDNVEFDEALGVISNPFDVNNTNLFTALDSLSSYHYHSSKAYKTAREDMQLLTCNVFRSVMEYYAKNRRKGFIETAFGRILTGPYIMFKAAVFYDYKRYRDYEYKISETLKYTCKQGHWSRERLFGYRAESKELGALFKNIDAAFRNHLGIKPEIKRITENKIYSEIIQAELLRLNEIKKQKSFEAVEIDFTKLDGIREAAEITKNKLIVEMDEEEITQSVSETPLDGGESKVQDIATKGENFLCDITLGDIELYFLSCLLRGEDYMNELKKQGVMVSVISDSVNDTLYELFDDTVIEFNGDLPKIVEDYKEDLKGMFNL